MADNKQDQFDDFGEALPVATPTHGYAEGMTNHQVLSAGAGLALMIAALAGVWTALQANGQIFGLFAYNGYNSLLALAAGVLAVYAAAVRGATKVIWVALAAVYAAVAVVGLVIGTGDQVFGFLANNYNNVWASGVIASIFAYLAMSKDTPS